jgi:TolB protein
MRSRALFLPVVAATCVSVSVAGASPALPSDETQPNHNLVDKILVTSDRHDPTLPGQINNGELYLLDLDGSGGQRLTFNESFDGLGSLAPDGKRIVFSSTRNRQAGERPNTSDLFLMNADGTDQVFLARGASPSWSPDGRYIAFHASASGTGQPIAGTPGAATEDSDIFVVNIDNLLEHGTPPRNLTNDPTAVDDDPDWSPDGTTIVYTSHDVTERPPGPNPDFTTAEIYLRNADGTGPPTRLTDNTVEERAPDWSHNGSRIAYMCRRIEPPLTFEICVWNRDPGNHTQLTNSAAANLTPTWLPNDDQILVHRPMLLPGTSFVRLQLWLIPANGGAEQPVGPEVPTDSTGFANIGPLRVKALK